MPRRSAASEAVQGQRSAGTMNDIIDEIKALPHFRDITCADCDTSFRVHTLEIHANCPKCGATPKCRAFGGIGTEVQDVIDAVLEWMGEGESLDAVMSRHKMIMEDKGD